MASLIVCRATMSIAFTKKEEGKKKKLALYKNKKIKIKIKKTVEIFFDKVRSSVPGAEEQ